MSIHLIDHLWHTSERGERALEAVRQSCKPAQSEFDSNLQLIAPWKRAYQATIKKHLNLGTAITHINKGKKIYPVQWQKYQGRRVLRILQDSMNSDKEHPFSYYWFWMIDPWTIGAGSTRFSDRPQDMYNVHCITFNAISNSNVANCLRTSKNGYLSLPEQAADTLQREVREKYHSILPGYGPSFAREALRTSYGWSFCKKGVIARALITLLTSKMHPMIRKIVLGTCNKGLANSIVRARQYDMFCETEQDYEDAWNTPVPFLFAKKQGISISDTKKLFKAAGLTKRGWSYLCGIRHHRDNDFVHYANGDVYEHLHLFSSIINMLARYMHKRTPIWVQDFLYDKLMIKCSDSQYYKKEEYHLYGLMIQRISLWSVSTKKFKRLNQRNRHNNEVVSEYPADIPGKQTVMTHVIDWYLDQAQLLTREQLQNKFDTWHLYADIWSQQRRRNNTRGYRDKWQWHSLLGQMSIKKNSTVWTITPLTNTDQLDEEAEKMSHCVWSYVNSCIQSSHFSRIFSLVPDSEEAKCATLEIINSGGCIVVGQCKAKYNAPNVEAERIGEIIAKLYQDACQEQIHQAPSRYTNDEVKIQVEEKKEDHAIRPFATMTGKQDLQQADLDTISPYLIRTVAKIETIQPVNEYYGRDEIPF